ncbi:restriction endonuclease subunit S [Pseudomonas sp. CAU 1711]|uniref:restriction endonuclease subunit S n=1 Tax=Pseudomonas sp. CAU 1711 TaxID=3140356 RepID=UPI003261C54B
MEKENKAALVPKLRFPEFRNKGPWSRLLLSELLRERKQRNRDLRFGPSEVLSVSGDHGCVNQIELLGRSYAGTSVKEYHVVETGDLVYTKSPLKRNPYGIIKENKGKPGIVSTLYAVYHVTGIGHSAYLDHFFSSDYNLNSYLQPIVRKGAKNDMKVNNAAVLTGEIWVPQMKEQRKIADCLNSLNELIAAQRRKVEALKTYKRDLIQQLFPLEGETLPRLRFPEFHNAPAWKSTTLDALVDFQSGGTPSKANPAFWNGSIPWVSAKDMKRLFLDDSEDHISASAVSDGAKLVPAGTVLLLTRGMTLLKDVPICVLRRKMSFNQDVKALRPKGKTEALFVAFLLLGNKRRLLKMVDIAGHGTGKLNTDELKALKLTIPTLAEQQRISECISSLDVQIEAEAEKLVVLNAHKDGLMQKIFPSLEGAK